MIDLGQYDAVRDTPRASNEQTFVYQVYAEPDTLIGEYATRREAWRVLDEDFDNRYTKKLTPQQYAERYGMEFKPVMDNP